MSDDLLTASSSQTDGPHQADRSASRAAEPNGNPTLLICGPIEMHYPMVADVTGATPLVATGRGFMSGFLGDRDARIQLFRDHIVYDRVIVAVRRGRAVGYATFKLRGRGPYAPGFADFRRVHGLGASVWKYPAFCALERRPRFDGIYLCGLKVVRKWRGHGIGRRLLMELERQAIQLNEHRIGLEVSLDNHVARNLYRSLGYTEKSELHVPVRNRFSSLSDVILMQKEIG
ncbi:acetyltransferase (GNAT) family protein [Paraburkholderia caballeronis]|uniref:GNAT family N-acetyltransferase n=1 Tax=Paraburkholderia caballeronis TaxID=416943 RepID=UPI001066A015|nr:GNAT family N-acetyltransferase [Paraburkholderia caballeronis]TDV37315.1 acetyltransferase (GNAT) family protein [Paraburkholderia caballeronis]